VEFWLARVTRVVRVFAATLTSREAARLLHPPGRELPRWRLLYSGRVPPQVGIAESFWSSLAVGGTRL